MEENKGGRLPWLVGILLILVFVVLAYWYCNQYILNISVATIPTTVTSQTASQPSTTTTTSTTATTKTDETADWKTYANTTYGFSFKYPNNWILETTNETLNMPFVLESEKSEAYIDPGKCVILLSVVENGDASALSNWFNANAKKTIGQSEDIDQVETNKVSTAENSKIVFLGQDAILQRYTIEKPFEGSPPLVKEIYFVMNNNIWKLKFITPYPDTNNLEKIFDNIYKSFSKN